MKRVLAVLTALIIMSTAAISMTGCSINKGGEPGGNTAVNTGEPANVDPAATGQPNPTAKPWDPEKDPFVARSFDVDRFSFDAEMMRFVELTQPGNYMISPLSFKYALGMLIAGARGETRQELLTALGLESEEALDAYIKNFNAFAEGFNAKIKKDKEHYDSLPERERRYYDEPTGALRVADSVWKRDDIKPFRDEFKRKLELYDAELRDFRLDNVVREVNAWANEKTEGLIPQLLPDNYDVGDLAVVLMNALYFKDSWQEPFNEIGTQPFHTADGRSVDKEFIESRITCRYYKDADTELAEIPMGNNVNFLVVLGSTDGLEAKLANAEFRRAKVILPKFEIETSLISRELCSFLQALGVTRAFNDLAAYSGRGEHHKLPAAHITRNARLPRDETGIEAAAVTAIMVKDGAVFDPNEPVVFRADRPFHFFIRTGESAWANESGVVMFAGRLAE